MQKIHLFNLYKHINKKIEMSGKREVIMNPWKDFLKEYYDPLFKLETIKWGTTIKSIRATKLIVDEEENPKIAPQIIHVH